MASEMYDLNFLISSHFKSNFKSHLWPVATMSDDTILDLKGLRDTQS